MNFAEEYLETLGRELKKLDVKVIEKIVDILIAALKNDSQVFIVGNGGSAAVASHLACDLSKGIIKQMHDPKEKRFRAISLTDNTPIITALANDAGYENIFSQQLSNLIKRGDTLIAISGSGNSENVVRAIKTAQSFKANTIAFLGSDGGKIKDLVDYSLIYNEKHYGRIEDSASILSHLICSWIKEKLREEKGGGEYFNENAGGKKPCVLITGGAGFIGSHTADLLAKKDYTIRILDNLEPPVHDGEWPDYVQNKGYELIRGSVTDKETLAKAMENVDYVYHLAAYQDQMPDFSKFFLVNSVSTSLIFEIILEKKLPIKKVVYSSSQFVYGDGIYISESGKEFFPELRTEKQFADKKWDILDGEGKLAKFVPFRESQNVNPTNSYGLSKIASEKMMLRLGKTYGIPVSIVRYSIVQGARQSPRNIYSGALRIFVTQALAGQPITVTEDGNQLRDFVNVEDVARANVLMIEDSRTNFEVYNVGGGIGYKIKDFAEMVKKITNSSSEILIDGRFRRTDTRNAVSDISKLKALGWTPTNTPEKSIRDYSNWIKEKNFNVIEIANRASEGAKKLI